MSEIVVYEFQERMLGAADATERRVLELWEQFVRGEISEGDLRMMVATVVTRANSAVVGVADASVSAQIEALTGTATPPTGVAPTDPTDDMARLLAAVETIQYATNSVDIAMQLGRLARAEPIATAQRAAVEAMGHQQMVEGWVRQMDGNPCQLCKWWSRDGRVWPKVHPFQRHPGCNCQPRVVLSGTVKPTEYTRRIERNA
jgi:hypothetical protein